MPTITIQVGGEGDGKWYTTDLQRRLAEYGIKASELAREAGMPRSQFSRYFNTPMNPSNETIQRIEQAFASILRKRAQKVVANAVKKSARKKRK